MKDNAPLIVGVRFSRVGKVYHFDAGGVPGVRNGDSVVVETSRGWQLGQIAQIVTDPPSPPEGIWKKVDRLATARDLSLAYSPGVAEPCLDMRALAASRPPSRHPRAHRGHPPPD